MRSAAVALLVAVVTPAAAAAGPRVVTDVRVWPGRLMTVAVTGFPAAGAVRVTLSGGGQCRPRALGAVVVDDEGGAWARLPMPRYRRTCAGRWRRWEPLRHVTITAAAEDGASASASAQVNPRH